MSEPTSVRPVMLPPPGFIEQAVERGLAQVVAEEALSVLAPERVSPAASLHPENDVAPPAPRKRRDSGIISGVCIDDTPTLPFIPAVKVNEE